VEKHVEISTTYFKAITNSEATNAERLTGIGAQAHDQHAEAKEWHHEQVGMLGEVAAVITTWTWRDEIRDKGWYTFPVIALTLLIRGKTITR